MAALKTIILLFLLLIYLTIVIIIYPHIKPYFIPYYGDCPNEKSNIFQLYSPEEIKAWSLTPNMAKIYVDKSFTCTGVMVGWDEVATIYEACIQNRYLYYLLSCVNLRKNVFNEI